MQFTNYRNELFRVEGLDGNVITFAANETRDVPVAFEDRCLQAGLVPAGKPPKSKPEKAPAPSETATKVE